jgi:hypothetical protein
MSTFENCLHASGLSVLLLVSCGIGQADEVMDWNHIMLEATLVPPATAAPVSTRSTAIVQAAVFDAVNGIDPQYTPIHIWLRGPRNASKRAAAVQAAFAILIRLYPAQLDSLQQQRSTSLTGISRGWGAERSESIQQGIEWGQTVADAIWAWRSNDGFAATPPPFIGGTAPGEWRPTSSATGLAPQLAHMTPWVIESPSQFRPPAPPALDTAQYMADFNEIKLMGSGSSSTRTADQTQYALFWNPGNPPDFWNPVAATLAESIISACCKLHTCSRRSIWLCPTPSLAVGMRSTPMYHGGPSQRYSWPTQMAIPILWLIQNGCRFLLLRRSQATHRPIPARALLPPECFLTTLARTRQSLLQAMPYPEKCTALGAFPPRSKK